MWNNPSIFFNPLASAVIEPLAFHNLPEQLAKSMTAHFLEQKKGSQNEAPYIPNRKVFYSSLAERLKSEFGFASSFSSSSSSSSSSDANETSPKSWPMADGALADDWSAIEVETDFQNKEQSNKVYQQKGNNINNYHFHGKQKTNELINGR